MGFSIEELSPSPKTHLYKVPPVADTVKLVVSGARHAFVFAAEKFAAGFARTKMFFDIESLQAPKSLIEPSRARLQPLAARCGFPPERFYTPNQ